ncbi:MAG: response regulator, partial [Spirochaetales bacterium]|nr:response regulator [Spirochaetales bacterium]
MKKVLLIDDSALFRKYLASKLQENGFEVVEAINGFDGSLKLRSEMPDLVIMEYYLSKKSSLEILKEKKANKNVSNVPVIMISGKMDKSKIKTVVPYNVKKFFSKPLKLDALLQAVSGFLNVKIDIDNSPCILDAHFNDDILFVEIALGLNSEKIELLKFKIAELTRLYNVPTPKVLLMLSNIEFNNEDASKLELLFNTILEQTGNYSKMIKVLSNSDFIKEFLGKKKDFSGIEVTDTLDKAMDDLLGLKPDSIAHDKVAAEKILTKSLPKVDFEETIDLRFHNERVLEQPEKVLPEAKIAVVDDDFI